MLSFPDLHVGPFDLLCYVILFAIVFWMAWRCNPQREIYRGAALAQYRDRRPAEAGSCEVLITVQQPHDLPDFYPNTCIAEVELGQFDRLFGPDIGATIPVTVSITSDQWGKLHAVLV